MKINSRNKGVTGERFAAKWLYDNLKLDDIPLRNLEQVREGGNDLTGPAPLSIEVKRCETLLKRDWWMQAVSGTTALLDTPVVMYRQSRQPWRFLISARCIGLTSGFVQVEEREFVKWASRLVAAEQYKRKAG